MKKIWLVLLGLFLAGCGSSSDFAEVSGSTQGQQGSVLGESFLINAGSGRLKVDSGRMSLQLNSVQSEVTTQGGLLSVEDFVRQLIVSPATRRRVQLTYRAGGVQKTANAIVERALLADQSSLFFTGSIEGSEAARVQAQQTDLDETFSEVSLRIGDPVLRSDAGQFFVDAGIEENVGLVEVVSTDSDTPYSYSTSTPESLVPLVTDRDGTNYLLTVSQPGYQDVTATAFFYNWFNPLYVVSALVPNGVGTGTFSVHAKYDDLFDTDASLLGVTIIATDSSYRFEGTTNDDGLVEFTGVPDGVEFLVYLVDDSGNQLDSSGPLPNNVEVTFTLPSSIL